jgi:uncharacterized membrane-anchored protein
MAEAASRRDEYLASRQEMNARFQAVHTFIGLTLTGFFTFMSVLLLFFREQAEGLIFVTPLLWAVLAMIGRLIADWQRRIYRLGSYILVFHEDGNDDLRWITRNRENPDKSFLRSEGNFFPYCVMAVISLLPGVFGLHTLKWNVCELTHSAAVLSSVGTGIWVFLSLKALRNVSSERSEQTANWRKVREQEDQRVRANRAN